jgi:hypothetical protein
MIWQTIYGIKLAVSLVFQRDYSNYRWYKGESINPYTSDATHPRAAQFWEYEKEFHMAFLDKCDPKADLKKEYTIWKKSLLEDHLPGESPNPYGDHIDWYKSI